jgi:hypothetical protein
VEREEEGLEPKPEPGAVSELEPEPPHEPAWPPLPDLLWDAPNGAAPGDARIHLKIRPMSARLPQPTRRRRGIRRGNRPLPFREPVDTGDADLALAVT